MGYRYLTKVGDEVCSGIKCFIPEIVAYWRFRQVGTCIRHIQAATAVGTALCDCSLVNLLVQNAGDEYKRVGVSACTGSVLINYITVALSGVLVLRKSATRSIEAFPRHAGIVAKSDRTRSPQAASKEVRLEVGGIRHPDGISPRTRTRRRIRRTVSDDCLYILLVAVQIELGLAARIRRATLGTCWYPQQAENAKREAIIAPVSPVSEICLGPGAKRLSMRCALLRPEFRVCCERADIV